MQVHDELVLEVPVAEVELVREAVQGAMEGVMELAVPLRVSISVGPNWAEAHG